MGLGALAITGLVLSAAGGVSSAVSASQQSKFNAKVAQQNAQAVEDARKKNRALEEVELEDRLSAIRAAQGASGFAFEGSPLAVFEDVEARFRKDQEVRDFEAATGAARNRNQAALLKKKAGSDLFVGLLNTAGNTLVNQSILFPGDN